MTIAEPNNRRWSVRRDVHWNARIRSNRHSRREAKVRNVGLEGLFLRAGEFPATTREVLELELEMPAIDASGGAGKKIYRMPVCVIHRWLDGMGVMFLSFNSAFFRELDRLIHPFSRLEGGGPARFPTSLGYAVQARAVRRKPY